MKKKLLKKLSAVMLAGAVAMSAVGCGNGGGNVSNNSMTPADSGTASAESGSTPTVEGKECTIGVALYSDSGKAVDAIKAYLESMSDTLNAKFKYTVLTQTDEAANLTKIQELISSGVDGIICTMDLGTVSILQECEAAGVYMAGFLSDYDTSFNNTYDDVYKNEYFLGTISDGPCTDEITGGQVFFDSLIEYNERTPDEPITHVSMAMFPAWAFPSQQLIADQFVAAVEEYNASAENPITVDTLDEETDVLQFSPMNSTYFSKHADAQAIMSFAAGTAFVYPTMVAAGVDSDIKLFTTGFEGGEEANFGTSGTGTYQQLVISAPEAINYPLVLLLNKINGTEFSDQPEDAERVSSAQLIINSQEDMQAFQNSLYYTADTGKAMYTAADVLAMTAYGNPDATYAALKASMGDMTIENLK